MKQLRLLFLFVLIYINIKYEFFHVDKVFSLIKSQKTGKSVMCGGGELESGEWVFFGLSSISKYV